MSPTRQAPLLHLAVLAALTGGLGALVPSVVGLGATEFQLRRLLLAVPLTLPALALAALTNRRHPRATALALVWPVSVAVNLALGHDVIAAALNWRLRTTDLCVQPCPCWPGPGCLVGIENHEHVERWPLPSGEVVHVVGGPGIEVPEALRAAVGRDRW